VTVLLQFFPYFDSEKKFENWSLFDEVIKRTISVPFLGHPVGVSLTEDIGGRSYAGALNELRIVYAIGDFFLPFCHPVNTSFL